MIDGLACGSMIEMHNVRHSPWADITCIGYLKLTSPQLRFHCFDGSIPDILHNWYIVGT